MGFASAIIGIVCLIGAILLPRFSIWLLIPAIAALILGLITVLGGIFKKRADNLLAGIGIMLALIAIVLSSGNNFEANQSISDTEALSNLNRSANSLTEPIPLSEKTLETLPVIASSAPAKRKGR